MVFSKNFNIMSALFVHQRPLCRKKSILAEVCFDAKIGLACACCKMNIYLKEPPFVPHLGLFAAKCRVKWCKTQCVLVLNAVCFGAK